MKTSVITVILSAAAIFAAISCQKEESVPGTQDTVKADGTIQVSIDASLGDLVAAEGTKATAEQVVRLMWEDGDKVDAYCGTTKLNSNPITVTPSGNKLFATLTGTITAPESGQTITFIYSNADPVSDEVLTFDFSSQGSGIPFVAYGTLKYDGTATFTNKMVGFNFATSVMKIAATNLGGGEISEATISGINTRVRLTPDDDSENCSIEGGSPATITKTAGITASDTRAIITVGLVPDNTSEPYRMLSVKQESYTNKGAITSTSIESSTSYTTPASLFTCGTLGTGEGAHDYVLIAGTRWATQNIAVSESGKAQWKSVTLPGTDTPVQIGDYFQWGASYDGYNITSGTDKKPDTLLIYSGFLNAGTTTESRFTFKSTYQFSETSIAPHYDRASSEYTKYTSTGATLDPSDDVAGLLWQGTWRMPTKAEFEALFAATYWAWDDNDKGYYVYAPQPGDTGKKNSESEAADSYKKSDALLFFPAVGSGSSQNYVSVSITGLYWSSTLGNSTDKGTIMIINKSNLGTNEYKRARGLTIRPVS